MDNSALVEGNGLGALKRAIEISRGQKALADRLDALGRKHSPPMRCKPQNVWAWLNRDGKVPGEWARFVAQAVDFQILPSQVRPDIYPNVTDGLPPDFIASEQFLRSLQYRSSA
jgi:DNA-binding transcriptional regulator YdaS (Cro superfamily)